MTQLYVLIRYLTFPGAYLRGFWEQIVCRICSIPVEDNRYLRFDEMCGHIEHELMPKASSAFAICFVPAFMNYIGSIFLMAFPITFLFVYETKNLLFAIITAISYWFAISLYLNSYSLVEDAINMMEKIYKKGNILQKIIYAPGAVCLFVGSYLEKYSITLLIAIGITVFFVIGM